MSQHNNWSHYFAQLGENQAFEEATQQTQNAINSLFKNADKPYSGLAPALLKKQINDVDFSQSASLKEVINSTNELIAKNSLLVQHPHTIAHLHTPPLIASIVAEHFIAALNQSMDSWDQSPAATFVEQQMIDWLCKTYELGERSDGVFTSGGTQSNLMGLLLARDWFAFNQSLHDVQQDGLPEYAQKMRIICSDKSHFTVQKSASLMGLGERSVVLVKTNVQGQIDVQDLQLTVDALKAQGLLPFAVVAMAGTTDHGAIDDIQAVVDIARNAGCWSHVDGAYGAALQLSQQHKSRLKGIESADSVSVDFHKLFYQTISCGALLIKNKANFNTLLHHADYLNREGDELPNLVDKSIATTKRFDALKMFMTLKAVGEKQLGEFYDYLLSLTQEVASKIEENQHFDLCCTPLLSTVLFRLAPSLQGNLTDAEFNQLHQQLRLHMLTKGEAVIAETKVNGRLALKFTLLSPCLTIADFDSLLAKIEQSAITLINNK
ncbi:aspartate aminotransferase family protein [Psychromonas sp.]|nr:aspartate aminotransferase family protein [Psychromonas sp.]